jgi:hypothetical protein
VCRLTFSGGRLLLNTMLWRGVLVATTPSLIGFHRARRRALRAVLSAPYPATSLKPGVNESTYVSLTGAPLNCSFVKLPIKPQRISETKPNCMPAKSKIQQMAAGAALSAKRGKRSKSSLKGASQGMYKSMSKAELSRMAKTKRKGKPTRKKRR